MRPHQDGRPTGTVSKPRWTIAAVRRRSGSTVPCVRGTDAPSPLPPLVEIPPAICTCWRRSTTRTRRVRSTWSWTISPATPVARYATGWPATRVAQVPIPTGACWLNLVEGWWRLFRQEALAADIVRIAGDNRARLIGQTLGGVALLSYYSPQSGGKHRASLCTLYRTTPPP